MRRHALVIGLGFLILAAVAVVAGWAFFEISTADDGSRTLGPLWAYAVGAVVVLAALGGFLAWLAAYAMRHGTDEEP